MCPHFLLVVVRHDARYWPKPLKFWPVMKNDNSASQRRKTTQLAMDRQAEAERTRGEVKGGIDGSDALWECEFSKNTSQLALIIKQLNNFKIRLEKL